MSYPIYDFELFQGEAKVIRVTVVDSDGAVIDISSIGSIIWKMGKPKSAPQVEKSLGSGISIDNGPAGVFLITLDAADTTGIAADKYSHEARLDDSIIVHGTIEIIYSLTK